MNEKIDWPSDRVAQGGLFHPHKVTYSKDTHDLIKRKLPNMVNDGICCINIHKMVFTVLMEEQKLTMFQRNKVNYNLRNGDPLPRPRAAVRSSGQDYEDRLAVEIMQRAKSARKRSLNVIQASGAFETERYVPLHHLKEPSNMQKQKLQETMSGIKEYPELDSLRVNRRDKHRRRPARQTGEQDPVEECESTKRFRREPANINSTIINSNERNPRACRLAGRHGSIGRRPGSSHCHSEPDCRASAHR